MKLTDKLSKSIVKAQSMRTKMESKYLELLKEQETINLKKQGIDKAVSDLKLVLYGTTQLACVDTIEVK
jgi:hypothetical protein